MPRCRGLGGLLVVALIGWSELSAAEEEVPGWLTRLGHSATYTAEAYTSYFPQTYPSTPVRIVDDRDGVFWSQATVKSQAPLNGTVLFRVKASAAYSSHYNELRGAFRMPDSEKPYAPYVSLKELSLRSDHSAFAVTLGRAPIPLGLATLYSPADRYRVVNSANPMKLDDLGAWQASLDLFLGENTLRLAVLPVEERPPGPHGRSRWVGDVGTDFVQADATAITSLAAGTTGLTIPEPEGSARTIFRNRPGLLAKYSGVVTGADYFAAFHYGPSVYPVMKNPSGNNFIVEIPSAFTTSAGFSKTTGALELHAEGVYQLTEREKDQDFLRYLFGTVYRETAFAERLGLDEVSATVEYAGDWATDEQDKSGYVVNSEKARPLVNSILFRVDFIPSDKWTLLLAGIRNLTGDDYAHGIGVEYRPNDNLTFRAGWAIFGGRQGTPFGRWNRNDHFEVGVVRRF